MEKECEKCIGKFICAGEHLKKCAMCRKFHKALESKLHSHNNDMNAIDLKCEISEILLSSYMSDERLADKCSAEIMEKVNQQRHV
jgi:hypothetical protein